MHNWANFCDITKFNIKNKNLVALVASRFFLDENACHALINKTVFLVPPAIDIDREYKIISARQISDNKLEISLNDSSIEEKDVVGKSLLLSENDAKEVFGENSIRQNDEYTGKLIVDKNLGEIGRVIDVAGTSAQKHFVVSYNNDEVLIPLSQELIEEESESVIKMDLPKGILEVNEA